MRELRRWAWTAALAVATASPALAQNTGGISGTGTGGIGNTGTGGIGGTGTGGGGGNSLQGGNSFGGSNQGTSLLTPTAAPSISAPSELTGSSNTAINASNFLQRTYANPYYQGYIVNYNSGSNPGGFGAPLYGTTTSTTTTGGGRGGQGGFGGGTGGAVSSTSVGGPIVPLPIQISYPAQLQFKVPVVQSQVLTDIQGTIARAPMITNPGSIQIVMDGPNVVIRGSVKDDDEARYIVGMVRLTPGVREIKNELIYPRTP